jgi:chromosome segregation ATPase
MSINSTGLYGAAATIINTDLFDDVQELKEDVSTSQTTTGDHELRIDTLETDNTTNKSNITAVGTDITNTQSDITDIYDNKIVAIETDITALQTDNTNNKSSITALQSDNTSNKSRLTSLETDNTTNKSNITAWQTNKQDKIKDITDTEILAEETKTINGNTIPITTTKGDFKGFKSRIGSLESQTSIIEEDITELFDNKQDNILEVDDTFVLATATYTKEGEQPLTINTTKGDFKNFKLKITSLESDTNTIEQVENEYALNTLYRTPIPLPYDILEAYSQFIHDIKRAIW